MSAVEIAGHPSAEFGPAQPIARVRHRDHVVVSGAVSSTRHVLIGGSPSFTCTLADGTGELDLLFIGRFTVPGFEKGIRCTAQGTARVMHRRLVIWNPLYRFEHD